MGRIDHELGDLCVDRGVSVTVGGASAGPAD